jgi:hypothetical protein
MNIKCKKILTYHAFGVHNYYFHIVQFCNRGLFFDGSNHKDKVALVLSQSKLLGGGLGLGDGVRVMIVNEILSFKKSISGCTSIQGFPRF